MTVTMSSRERVAAALRGEEPDRVPWCDWVDRKLLQQLMSSLRMSQNEVWSLESQPYTVEESKAISSFLQLDNITYILKAPVYSHKGIGKDGRQFYGDGMIATEADLPLLELPDPYDDALYAGAEEFVSQREGFSAWLVTRIGIMPTMLSMGTEPFALALYDNRPFVEEVLDRYCEWVYVVAERVCQLGFDVFMSTDDMAFKTNTFFSPQVFREMVLPRYQRVREKITIPWIIHSDGNMLPFMDDLLSLGIAGFHPNEKGAMDIRGMKRDHGDRLCLLGNVDLNILGAGTPQDVDEEVRQLIRDVGAGGGYIISSGNSLADYLLPENVLAMRDAIQKYGDYPINLE